ncbi:MAG: hypothetical protein PHT79_10125 [Syntrophomonadaceae bacterium]|nr:hypothetical protein [Syntrophomonadaceae bacterium]MDD4550099.1 hypothetical protein [Syntrophomonadaceae bacterium]
MKLRKMKSLPVFYVKTAEIIGRVEKAVIGDDYTISYVVAEFSGREPGMILADDFELREEALIIQDLNKIKSYAYGEELSMYDSKMGDVIFNSEGREMGKVSDFIICPHTKKVWGLEVFSGAIKDLLEGRQEIALEQVCWKSVISGVLTEEGSDQS